LGSNNGTDASGDSKPLTPTPSAACTAACTSKAENANAGTPDSADLGSEGEGADTGDPLAKLAAALLTLSLADRARLAAMLNVGAGEGGPNV